LRNNKDICVDLFKQLSSNRINLNKKTVSVKTQSYYELPNSSNSGARIDMEVRDTNTIIFCEHKIRSKINEYEIKKYEKEQEKTENEIKDQIDKYKKVIDDLEGKRREIFLFINSRENIGEEIEDLEKGKGIKVCLWEEIYSKLKELKEIYEEKYKNTEKNNNTLSMFLDFMEGKGMTKFIGFKREDFIFGDLDESNIKEDYVHKNYFDKFTKSVYEKLKEFDKRTDWKYYIYHKQKGRRYNHYYFKKNVDLSLNINTEISKKGLDVHMWLPLWDKRGSPDIENGKIDQRKLYKKIIKFKQNYDKKDSIVDKFYSELKNLSVTFEVILQGKQYYKYRSSVRPIYKQNDAPFANILTIQFGSEYIFSKNNKLYIVDPKKEIFDSCRENDKTNYTTSNKYLIRVLFKTLFNDFNDPEENKFPNNRSIALRKVLPIEYVKDRGENIVEDVVKIILEFKKIIIFLNELD